MNPKNGWVTQYLWQLYTYTSQVVNVNKKYADPDASGVNLNWIDSIFKSIKIRGSSF